MRMAYVQQQIAPAGRTALLGAPAVQHPQQMAAGQRLHRARAERRQPDRPVVRRLRQQQPALARGHPGDPGDPAVVIDHDGLAADPRQERGGDGAQALQIPAVGEEQFALGPPGGRGDQGEHRRMGGPGGAADVDDAQQPSVPRVVDGGGGTAPGVEGAHEMLRRMHPHGGLHGQRGADSAGPGDVLGPVRTLHERDAVGLPADAPMAVEPQDAALRIGDDHDVACRLRRLQQPVVQGGQHLGQPGLPPPQLQLVQTQRPRGAAAVRVEAQAQHPVPGGADDGAGGQRKPSPAQRRLADHRHETGRFGGAQRGQGTGVAWVLGTHGWQPSASAERGFVAPRL
ncbi:hypothetical protein SANT12839_012440 [Streptomyces antimycoticus]|uniref:Uncharacterized protein n=1 Tax=Streptomyces antimycoticus TaxID=68175 RepID=A0A4D4JX44_9ACTN|nr:hypothetical protein SANT12839_012440 [Streptomyces antimycoticus]